MLEPGQRIFTIGSCFARGIEKALAARGFDIPTLGLQVDKTWWTGDPVSILNNYVPPAIAPQIRWAFGLEEFDLDRHAIEVAAGRYIDPQLTLTYRPVAAESLIKRRNDISAIYRHLATSNVVLITLGLIEAWFDNRSGLYINCPPPKGDRPDRSVALRASCSGLRGRDALAGRAGRPARPGLSPRPSHHPHRLARAAPGDLHVVRRGGCERLQQVRPAGGGRAVRRRSSSHRVLPPLTKAWS
jgi:hypothetical protein